MPCPPSRTQRRGRLVVRPRCRGDVEFRDLTFGYGGPRCWTTFGADRGGADRGPRRPDRVGQVHAAEPAAEAARAAAGHGVPRRRGRARPSLADLRGAIGFVPQEAFLFSDRWPTPSRSAWRRGGRRRRADRVGRLRRAARQGRRGLPEGLRDDCGRARHHAVGRPEAAHGDRARPDDRPAHPDAGRCAVGGGHLYRGGDPARCAASCGSARRSSCPIACRPCATRIRSWCSTTAGSSSAERTTSWCASRVLRRAVPEAVARGGAGGVVGQTDVDTRRRGPRQGLRRAADAAADGLPAPVRLQVALALARSSGVAAAVGAALPDEARHRPLHRAAATVGAVPGRPGVSRHAARGVRVGVRADLRHAVRGQRIMFDMRMQIYGHLQRAGRPVLRPQSGRTADDPRDDRRRRPERPVLGRRGCGLRRRVHAGRHHGRADGTDWRLALVAFAVLPLIVLVTQWFRRNVRESYRTVRLWIARINAFLQENITGDGDRAAVQAGGRALREVRRDRPRHRDANIESIFYYAVFYPAIEATSALASALIIWSGGGWVLAGALTLGSLVAFFQYSQRFFRPISDMSEKFNLLQTAMASSERIFKLLDTEPTIASGRWHLEPSPGRPRIARTHVPLTAPAVSAPAFLRPRLVRLLWRGLGAQGRVVRGRAGPAGRHRRRHRRREVDDHQPAAALLRRRPGPHPARRRRYPRAGSRGAARGVQPRAAGRAPLLGDDCANIRLGTAASDERCGGRPRPCTRRGSSNGCRRP